MFDVITIGNATIDAFLGLRDASVHCRVDEKTCELCIKYGEKIPVDSCIFSLGGDACNVAVGAARLGLSSALCAEIGDDEFAEKIANTLEKEHVDKSLLQITIGAQSTFAIAINFKNERTMFVQHVTRDHQFLFGDAKAQWAYLTSLGNVWEHAYDMSLAFVKNTGARLMFAPGTVQVNAGYEKIRNVLEVSDIFILNREEAETIIKSTGKGISQTVEEILPVLQKLGPKMVIVTDGVNGSSAIDAVGKTYFQAIFPEKIVERTGAGDAYSVGFLAATMQGKPVQEAMMWGTINAGSVVEQIGAEPGLLTKEGLEEKLKNNPITK